MYDRKGISELIAAFCTIASEFPDANLYLIGDEADREKFQAQASGFTDRLQLSDVIYLKVDHEYYGIITIDGCGGTARSVLGMGIE